MKVAISVCFFFPLFSMDMFTVSAVAFAYIVLHGTMITMFFHSSVIFNAKISNFWTAPYVISSLECSVADNSKYFDH